MLQQQKLRRLFVLGAGLIFTIGVAQAQNTTSSINLGNPSNGCGNLPSQSALKAALVAATAAETSGLQLQMWATIVDRDGIVCAVAFTGVNRGAQWPGSRVISAQKANAANAFSLDFSSASNGSGNPHGLALSTANLYSAVQPGGSLFGLATSNPVDTAAAYAGPSLLYGTPADPMVGNKVGGINVFGGGLALYGPNHQILGALGVSGDTSCTDHYKAWRTRHNLILDWLAGVNGVSGDTARPDNIVFDIAPNMYGGTGISAEGFGHPTCLGQPAAPSTLPAVR